MWQQWAAVGVVVAAGAGWWWLSPKVEVTAVPATPTVAQVSDEAVPAPAGPLVEVARFNPGGAGIIAGSVSSPGAVRVMLGGVELARAEPDSAGQFAVFVTVPARSAPQRLTVEQDGAGASGSVIVAPAALEVSAAGPEGDASATGDTRDQAEGDAAAPGAAADTVVAVGDGAGGDPVPEDGATGEADAGASAFDGMTPAQTSGTAASDALASGAPGSGDTGGGAVTAFSAPLSTASDVAGGDAADPRAQPLTTGASLDHDTVAGSDQPVSRTTRAPEPAPVASGAAAPEAARPVAAAPATTQASAPVLVADASGVRVMDQSRSKPDVALDAISYDPLGAVGLAGRANASRVQIYLDNRPVTAAPVRRDGDWRIDLPDVDRGVYTLRVDAVDDSGAVVSRLETPFKREAPRDIARVMAEQTAAPGFDIAVRTVQPGNTLWAIARETYGEGILYVHVFDANADLIRDPDLIYPGQIFRLPDLDD